MPTIKDCFISRWGTEGRIMEVDFSQLEVIGAAEISGDSNMRKDILDGVDSHSQSAAWLNPQYTYDEIREGYLNAIPVFEKMRKNAKAPRFELQYGAGYKSIAKNNNISEEAAQGFIDRYYERYAGLKAFQDSVAEAVEQGKYPIAKDMKGHKICAGDWVSCTGRRYYFQESEAPKFLAKKGIYYSFSPTKFKNYPMQGFATGDIVPEMLGRVMRNLFKHKLYDYCLPVNTIHDSILFDVRLDKLPECVRIVRSTMKAVPLAMEKRFGLTLTLPFNVDVEIGESWENMKGYEG